MMRNSLIEQVRSAKPLPDLVFLDFDHTLFGGNSTEAFLAQSTPISMVRVLDFFFRRCLPWRLTLIPRWYRLRDLLFVKILLWLSPWNLRQWQADAPALFAKKVNHELENSLAEFSEIPKVIISFGIEGLIRPMLRGSAWEHVELLAASSRNPRGYFFNGKLEIVRQARALVDLKRAMLITDSEDDFDLLSAVGFPVLIAPYVAR